MTWTARLVVARLVCGGIWAGAMIAFGWWLWLEQPVTRQWPFFAVCPLAGGELVLMSVVLDELYPRALPAVTGMVKWMMALLFWASGGLSVWWLFDRLVIR